MVERVEIHRENPQPRLIKRAADLLRDQGVLAYPTDSAYALGCAIDSKDALERIQRLRRLDPRHHLTLMCRDLSEIATYAKVGNSSYRLIKSLTPGPYTFLLKATREVPRRLQNPKRSTIGIRVPGHPVALALLDALGAPMFSTTLRLPEDEHPLSEPDDIAERLRGRIDLLLDAGACGLDHTTIIDLSDDAAVLVREGKGPVTW